jgi:hypothetical protein
MQADRRADGRTDRLTGVTKFIIAFRDFRTRLKINTFTEVKKIIFKETKTLTKMFSNKPLIKFHPVEFVLPQKNSSTYDKIITNLSQNNYTISIQLQVSNVCYMFRSYDHDLVERIYTY